MTIDVTMLLMVAVLVSAGIYLMLERTLTRVLLGILLLGNGVNVLILTTGGPGGLAPLVGAKVDPQEYSDPLPQAMILTAIVISFAVTAFLLGMIYRSWWLSRADEIQTDAEDVRVSQEGIVHDPEEDGEMPVEDSEFATQDEVDSDDDGGLGEDPDNLTPAQAARTRAEARRVVDEYMTEMAREAEREEREEQEKGGR
ncbi:Na(+)/H(+) antiporter subunit C [Pseudoglutamicibacter albus]|uniref:Na(+)/H(+) antiporter subunit C n=1 Tax=Pseudoglutamicibacter TaxID=1742991 RepID=UPI000C77A485|nr:MULTISPECIES: Na(+)/H(+) antiporter subunit C [Pseudoglutamicibacter]MBM7795582.1 multicomponent Na+:H+ antiporter subunit C [Pseudoglutamicibacter cumminsii]MCT1686870.1 Na(+)/H(+) antiporter subunit C [Pseudoglutamicibacter cumminsii]PKY80131.1 Na(+)/H(+) antiporter subunit C [Pseudoglutamicibacter albus]WIK83719.1 Na(+)/H(+) antiporter subunit C [Pseudoglutamicibacter albus]